MDWSTRIWYWHRRALQQRRALAQRLSLGVLLWQVRAHTLASRLQFQRMRCRMDLWFVLSGMSLYSVRTRRITLQLRNKIRMYHFLWGSVGRAARDSHDPLLWAIVLCPVLLGLWPVLWLLLHR